MKKEKQYNIVRVKSYYFFLYLVRRNKLKSESLISISFSMSEIDIRGLQELNFNLS
jgi:hypothetical protein